MRTLASPQVHHLLGKRAVALALIFRERQYETRRTFDINKLRSVLFC